MITRTLTIEGITFEIAPTPVFKLAPLNKYMQDTSQLFTEEGQTAMQSAIYWGARRCKDNANSQGITLDWLQMNIDSHNVQELYAAWRDLNQVKKLEKGNGAGEGDAARPSP